MNFDIRLINWHYRFVLLKYFLLPIINIRRLYCISVLMLIVFRKKN